MGAEHLFSRYFLVFFVVFFQKEWTVRMDRPRNWNSLVIVQNRTRQQLLVSATLLEGFVYLVYETTLGRGGGKVAK